MKKVRFPFISLILLLALPLTFVSCSKDDEDPQPVPSLYVEAVPSGITSVTQVKAALTFVGLTSLSEDVKYNYETFYFTYRTEFQGEEIIASGLMAIPDGDPDEEFPIMSVQHGTLVAERDSPSENIQDNFLFLAGASFGYYVVLPDFIGFGETRELLHPYIDEKSSADVVKDIVFAAQEYIGNNADNFNGELFLTGYSQGGYVTFAAQKWFEENPVSNIELVASAPAAGAYDVVHMKDYFLSLETYEQPFYLAYIIHNYNTYYNWDQPLSDFFQDPYAGIIPELFNGSRNGSEINAALTNTIGDLLQPEMIDQFDSDPRYSNLSLALEANTLVDWTPTTPTRLYHGTADVTVPYENSIISYDKLIANGSTSIELVPIENATHATGLLPFAESVLTWFGELKN